MNREIKFRAWFPSEKRITPIKTVFELCENAKQYGKNLDSELILLQYTGIKDKAGNEIFEGDILEDIKLDGTKFFYKIWREKGGLVVNIHQDDFYRPIGKIFFYEAIAGMQTESYIEGSLVIIGNIYENPELINQPISAIGVMNQKEIIEDRLEVLRSAISYYMECNTPIPQRWIDEVKKLQDILTNKNN